MPSPSTSPIALLAPSPHSAESLRQYAQSQGQNLDLTWVDSTQPLDAIAAACPQARMLIVGGSLPNALDLAERLPHLELIQTHTAGTDWLDVAGLARRGVRVADNGGANAVAVAEITIALIIAVYRRLDRQFASARQGRWQQEVGDGPFFTLEGKRVGLVGLGRIGSRVARRLAGWECDLVFHDTAQLADEYCQTAGARRLPYDELLGTSDVVSLHVPLNRKTRGMFGAAQLALMQKSAVLVNTCRGPVIDEAALIDALQQGALYGAGLDVTQTEPPAADNPLLQMENVVITPHLAARSAQSGQHALQHIAQNAARLLRGQSPLAVVEPV